MPDETFRRTVPDVDTHYVRPRRASELMRAGSIAGCVVRDAAYYLPYYRRDVLKKEG